MSDYESESDKDRDKNRKMMIRFQKTLELQAKVRGEELRRLLESPDLYIVAQTIVDRLYDELRILCNFKHVVDNYNRKVSIQDVLTRLEGSIDETFVEITGNEYVPKIVRTIRYKVRKNKERREKEHRDKEGGAENGNQ